MEKRTNSDGKHFLLPVMALLVLLCAAGGCIFWLHQKGGPKVAKAQVMRRALTDTYTEEGRLTGGDRLSIVSEVSGPVAEIFVSQNTKVHTGDLLYKISDSDYRYALEQAEAAILGLTAQLDQSRIGQMMTSSPTEYLSGLEREREAARAAFESAQTSYNAAQALYATGDIALVELEQLSAQFRSAQSAYTQAQARYDESNRKLEELKSQGLDTEAINEQFYNSEKQQLEAQIRQQEEAKAQQEEQIGKCEVRADRDGLITALPIKSMSMVTAGQVTAELQSTGELYAETDILTSIAPYIRKGDKVEIRLHLRGMEETAEALVTEVYDYAEKGTSALGLDEYRVHVKAKLSGQNIAKTVLQPEKESAPALEMTGTDPQGEDTAVMQTDLKAAETASFSGREGYGVDMVFTLFDADDALTVPAGAVFKSGQESYVYVIEDGHAVRRHITIAYSAASETVIDEDTSDLKEGETVIDQVDTKGIYEGAAVR